MAKKEITLPYNFTPRDYQLSILQALDSGYKKAIWVLHRRAGKDLTIFNWVVKALFEKPQICYYILPTYAMAKKIIWEGGTKEGVRFLDFIPKEIIEKKSESELSVRFRNGSYLQLVGSDNYDRLVGTNPQIVVFSEYALQNPKAYEYIRPILTENDGVCIMISTPRGHNAFYDLCEMAKKNDDWFYQKLGADDTGAISKEAIEKERLSGMSEELIQQEFYCSFESSIHGSYYGQHLTKAKEDGRICNFGYDPSLLVYTAWDLGISDSMSIVFFQAVGSEVRIIDHYENHGYALSHYINVLREKKYAYGTHFLPHDGRNRNLSDGKRLISIANESEYNFDVVDSRLSVMEGIEAVRSLFPHLHIQETKCAYLIKCLQQYHAEYNDKAQVFLSRPAHDWSSHTCDAVRIMAIAVKDLVSRKHMTEEDAYAMERAYALRR